MGINRFLTPFADGFGEPPGRYYARLDQFSETSVLMDAVGADWFDENMDDEPGFARWRERANEAETFVVEIFSTLMADNYQYYFGGTRSLGDADDVDDADIWMEIELGMGLLRANIYPNLFAAPVPANIRSVQPIAGQKARQLTNAFSLDALVASEAEILAALHNLNTQIDWIGIYDVGQGNANGLCDRQAMPLAYFDLGGGVLQNSHSFSNQFVSICTTVQPPVILSHWDWDHWSSGTRFPNALALTWIVPNQLLGAVHATFAAAILNGGGKILVWPNTLHHLQKGQCHIHKCTGQGRNHSGLALEIDGPRGEEPILLTGDARYNVIPTRGQIFTSVVVPHHGADMRNRSVPACPRFAASRAAYSAGNPNSFLHPRAITQQDHHGQHWDHGLNGSIHPVDRYTAALRPVHLGHIGLSWSSQQGLPVQPCPGNACSLQLTQR